MSRQIPPRRSKISTVEVVGRLGTPYSMFSWIQLVTASTRSAPRSVFPKSSQAVS